MVRVSWTIEVGPMQLLAGSLQMKKGSRGVRERFEEATLLALKVEEEVMSQGTWAALEGYPLS